MSKQSYVAALAAITFAGACGDNITPIDPVTLSARVSGLTGSGSGSGLVLRLNGMDTITVAESGAFEFPRKLTPGSDYEITIVKQPAKPAQVCTIENPTGIIGDDPIDISIACEISSFHIGGVLAGLLGSGLEIQNNGGNSLALNADGTFTFPQSVQSGKPFAVTIASQPTQPSQTCSVAGGKGVIGSAPVTSVVVDCATDRFTVGGTVSGLAGTLFVKNEADGAMAMLTANGSFALPATVASGGHYSIEVMTQPTEPSQTCTITNGDGSVSNADITDIDIDCVTNKYALRGNLIGLEGSGLVLQVNGGDNLPLGEDGPFEFPSSIESGKHYEVSVLGQPSEPTQTCGVDDSGTGTIGGADVTNIGIKCKTSMFAIRANVSGLAGSGLVLRNNGVDNLPVSTDGQVTFSQLVASGETYAVSVLDQPSSPAQTCEVVADSGRVGAGDVETVAINCTTNKYIIGGSISGLAGTIVLQNNHGDDLPISTNGSFAFAAPVESGQSYAVSILAQPASPSQTCTISTGGAPTFNGFSSFGMSNPPPGSGIVGGDNVSNIVITCKTNTFYIGGAISSLVGSGLVLRNNGGDDLPVTANGTFEFLTPVESGQPYAVTVATQPSQPSQTCELKPADGTVAKSSGIVGGSNIGNIEIACTTNKYLVGGAISGLVGSVTLQNNGGDDLEVSENGSFHFHTKIASGGVYDVTIAAQPSSPAQTCSFSTASSGAVIDDEISGIVIVCETDAPLCGGENQACCTDSSIECEQSLICGSNGRCEMPPPPCGSLGMMCCGGSCYDGSTCGTTGVCESAPPTCGGLGDVCCANDSCDGGLKCNFGQCEMSCGNPGEVCCGDDICWNGVSCNGGICGGIPG